MPLTSWTTWAAEATADATKVNYTNATSKEAPAAGLQNITRTSSRERETSLGQKQSDGSDRRDRGSAPLQGKATSKEAEASKEAHDQQNRQQHQGAARTTSARERKADRTTDKATNAPPAARAPGGPVGQEPTTTVASKAACRAKADRPSAHDERRRDRPRTGGRATATARCALLACSLLVWVGTPRPGLRPHTGPGTRRKTRAGVSHKSPHEKWRKPKVEKSYGSRRKPKDEHFIFRDIDHVRLESQNAYRILVSYVWYTLNWNAMSQRLPWQTAGSGGDHA
jgi:hypothetical protein